MELLAPAGDSEKLAYAYRYGADAAYIGWPLFSLRARAGSVPGATGLAADHDPITDPATAAAHLAAVKGDRRLYCALNIYFTDTDIGLLREQLATIALYPFDALIVSDIGIVPLLQKYLPAMELHLSTQANCTNAEAALLYYRMGFSRIVPARELSLAAVAAIKDRVPELALEVFVHGAMCIAYSGRCLVSAWTTGRSANRGDCAHSCRWHYRAAVEESQRPGEWFPVEQSPTADGAATSLFSSRDICMIDHTAQLAAAGVDAAKIEGRMKSLYYVAVTTRAYRWAIDHPQAANGNPYRDDLWSVSHRQFSTGFYFDRGPMDEPTTRGYQASHLLVATVEAAAAGPVDGAVALNVKNSADDGDRLEVVRPGAANLTLAPGGYRFFDAEGRPVERIVHGRPAFLTTADAEVPPLSIIRRANGLPA